MPHLLAHPQINSLSSLSSHCNANITPPTVQHNFTPCGGEPRVKIKYNPKGNLPYKTLAPPHWPTHNHPRAAGNVPYYLSHILFNLICLIRKSQITQNTPKDPYKGVRTTLNHNINNRHPQPTTGIVNRSPVLGWKTLMLAFLKTGWATGENTCYKGKTPTPDSCLQSSGGRLECIHRIRILELEY